MVSIQKNIRVNERIRVPEVRVIGPNSEQLGILVVRRAIEIALSHGLDLVEVAPLAKPPVCRIMDFSKYKYDQEKKERRVKRSQHISHLKQIRVKPHIEENDYQVKLRQVLDFLEKKDKVKINLMFRGREMNYRDQGQRVLDKFLADTATHAQMEKAPIMEGKVLSVVLIPKAEKSHKKEDSSNEDDSKA